MYLSRLILNLANRAVQRDLADCQQMHRTLMSLFPQTGEPSSRAALGVLFRVEEGRGGTPASVLLQSKVPPDWSRLVPGYAAPPVAGEVNPACKPIGERYATIAKGARLAFRLRANPTKKVDTKSAPDGARRNGRRVILKGEDAQVEWLARKAEESGFALVAVRARPGAAGGRQTGHRNTEGAGGARATLTFGAVLFEGELEVTDPVKFRVALAEGIGPGKAYGFGLLSVAPLSRAG